MRTPVIAGNWKMYKKQDEAVALIQGLIPLTKHTSNIEIIVAPVFTCLPAVHDKLKGTNIHLSAQNCYCEEEGAYTGEISPGMLVDAGCSHVIIGHSERRQYFGETDATVNKKLSAAIKSGLNAIFCIGETLDERESEKTFNVLRNQVCAGLAAISATDLDKLIIAYEPVWAIGTGKTANDDQAQEVHAFIRGLITELYDVTTANSIRILYGGSVKPENIKGLMSQPDIDGALVGGASLKADSFANIVNFAQN